MGRPPVHESERKRARAHRLSKKKYDLSIKRLEARTKRTSEFPNACAQAKEVIRYALKLKSTSWSSSVQEEILPLPHLPWDLVPFQRGQWLVRSLSDDARTIYSFKKVVARLNCEWDLDPTEDDEIDHELSQYTPTEIMQHLDGWYCRNVIDSFLVHWKTVTVEQNERMLEATRRQIERLWYLERDLSTLDKWLFEANIISSSGRNCGPRRLMFARATRFWWYAEMCLLRYELWQRFRHPFQEMIILYRTRRLGWQMCWEGPAKMDGLISGVLFEGAELNSLAFGTR